MLWAAIFQAIAQGITNAYTTWNYMKENKRQAKETQLQAQEQADYRAKQAKYNMQQQKTSFLKSGVYFDSGSPINVIAETYNVARQDIDAINRDSITQQKRLKRAGKTAFFTHMIDPVGNNSSQLAGNIYSYYQNRNTSQFQNNKSNGTMWSGSTATDSTSRLA